MDDDMNISKAEFLADFFCSNLAKEVYKSAQGLESNTEVVESLVHFANLLWDEIEEAIKQQSDDDDTDY